MHHDLPIDTVTANLQLVAKQYLLYGFIKNLETLEMSKKTAISPIAVDVTTGTDYWWCACGRSKSQPFCDGSHKGSEFKPLQYTAIETKTLWFCVCKKTGNQPLCDGSHSK